MRLLSILLGCLAAGSCLGQSQLVLTRLHDAAYLDGNEHLNLNLQDYFQFYESPGPVATFIIDMPDLDEGEIILRFQGKSTSIVKYKLAGGSTYDDPYAVGGDDYVWSQHLVEFQLFAEQVPNTVANFMSYAQDGAYENTIIHRNESTGTVFRPQIFGADFAGHSFSPLPIIQAGGYRLYPGDTYVLQTIGGRDPIQLEEIGFHGTGTLAAARSTEPDAATSQFFINLDDNTAAFPSAFAVYGQLLDPVSDLPVLTDLANAPVYDLSSPYIHGEPNLFPGLPFHSIPLYAPYPYEKASYARISSIEIPKGNPDGVLYSYEWIIEGDESTPAERANQAVFEVDIDGPRLKISRNDTGKAKIRIIGSSGDGQRAEFILSLTAYNPGAMEVFPASDIYQQGWIENEWYGWLTADTYPEIYHQNHRTQYISELSSFDSIFLYDFGLGSWMFTNSVLYPFMYSYHLETWLWYQVGSGDFDSSRWFYVYDTDNPRWVLEEEILAGSKDLSMSLKASNGSLR